MVVWYYRVFIVELKNFKDFILFYYGLGQVYLKFGDWKVVLVSFEKVLEFYLDNCEMLKVVGYILGY